MDIERLASIRSHVSDLVEIFLDNMEAQAFVSVDSNEEHSVANVTDDGMKLLSIKFDTVPFLDRVAVYSMFLDELMLVGVPYDEGQFEQVPGSVH